ncbi:MAG: trypsin-like peptidase domain-containing protein [Candidatus Parcubacteria bacterium]|nr:trypsin-like peptidase domain-containing protein [Candidatus Parcubacteria bacterium]
MEEQNIRKLLITTIIVSLAGSVVIGFGAGFYFAKGSLPVFSQPVFNLPNNNLEKKLETYVPITDYETKIVNAVKNSQNSVISIIATKDLPVLEKYYIDPFSDGGFDIFGFQIPQYRQNGTKPQQVSAGSGFIISSDGYILTNKHVVSDQKARYTVMTNDGVKYDAKIISLDPLEDFAVIKIEKTGLKPLILGDSSILSLGQTTIAIGNALGEFKNTVSVGVISGLERTIQASGSSGKTETLSDVIQTDAAINPGNSGGPLLNLKGEVIGINTAIVSGAQNIGFAIPVNHIKKAWQSVLDTGKIQTPFLGVSTITINDTIKEEKKLSINYGALIIKGSDNEPAITVGSPAEKAGLKEGDIILSLNGEKIDATHALISLVRNYNVGETVALKVLRNEKEIAINVVLAQRQE